MKPIKMTCLALAILSVASIAQAQDALPEVYPSLADIPKPLRQMMNRDQYSEQYISQVLSVFRSGVKNKDSLSEQDIEALKEKNRNDQRRRQVQEIISYDRDFDGQVTREDMAASFSERNQNSQDYAKNKIDELMKIDTDSDGIITVKEMSQLKEDASVSRFQDGRYEHFYELMTLDPNGDGKLTAVELETLARKSFRTIDKNVDGALSQEELADVHAVNMQEDRILNIQREQDRKKEALKEMLSKCDFPSVAADEKIVVLGVYTGNSVSTVSVAGQVEETNVIPVQVDSSEEKLYLVASSYTPAIWQITGDVGRISRLILVGPSVRSGTAGNDMGDGKINAGAVGIPADKITFRRGRDCGLTSAYESSSAGRKNTLESMTALVGRVPDFLHAGHSITGIHIFNGRVNSDISSAIEKSQEQAPSGFDSDVWHRHITFMPGGLIDLKDAVVVSDVPAEPYQVFPNWAGLAKLVSEGYLVHMRKEGPESIVLPGSDRTLIHLGGVEAININGSLSRIEFDVRARDFRIVKNIPYYPSGLGGGFAANFFIAKGVDLPKGDPRHSTVVSEETGQVLAGPGAQFKNIP